ncbi:aldolase/citrate lyase family protein [Sphingomonadaceae bacterium jetA1]|jgi:4-hydroxy-2-oxoheptanedioate aldolase|uniref:HpcH/HpaI aldolase family protein n=1 Tax=Facivitalis istanbulensis TaxID=3075838 RepID=UPI003475BD85
MTHGSVAAARLSLRGTDVPIGIYISSTDPTTTEIAAAAGLDFVMIDGEHGPLDRHLVLGHVRAAKAAGIVPIARMLEGSDTQIQALLDVGCAGVVVPKVETAADATRIVRASRYAPTGRRGMCPACHDGGYSVNGFRDRMTQRDRETLVIPIIETRKALDNIAEIAAVDGIDVIHFGPGDLSADMGLDLAIDLPVLRDAWVTVRDVCHAAGKALLVPDNMGFEGGDLYIWPMELMLLRSTLEAMMRDRAAGAQ